jgi:hypothetical protein
LGKENNGRPAGKGVASTVMPRNITTEDISTSVVIVRADMPQTLRVVECFQVLAETHDWRTSLGPADCTWRSTGRWSA